MHILWNNKCMGKRRTRYTAPDNSLLKKSRCNYLYNVIYVRMLKNAINSIIIRRNNCPEQLAHSSCTINVDCWNVNERMNSVCVRYALCIYCNDCLFLYVIALTTHLLSIERAVRQSYMTCLMHVALKHGNVNFRQDFRLEFVPQICY